MEAAAWSRPSWGWSWRSVDHEVHFISYAQPIRLSGPHPNIHYHEVEVSRYPLFEYPPYDLALASRMAEVAELYDLDLLARSLCDSAFGECAAGAPDDGGQTPRTQAPVRDHAARHRHHAGRARPLLSAHHPILDRAERWSNRDLAVSYRSAPCASSIFETTFR